MSSLLTKILGIVVIVLILGGITEGMLLKKAYHANSIQAAQLLDAKAQADAARAQANAYKADSDATRKAFDSLSTNLSTLQKQYDTQSKKLSDALNKNKDWASKQVPKEVLDAIYGDEKDE